MNKNNLLKIAIEDLELSPTMEINARDKAEAMETYLNNNMIDVNFKPQGSFLQGTVIRPYKGGRDRDYDLDVLSIKENYEDEDANKIKNEIGYALKNSSEYKEKLEPEDPICWTLKYAEISPGIGFKLDIVPSAYKEKDTHENLLFPSRSDVLFITNKENGEYNWNETNSLEFGKWFLEISDKHLSQDMIDKQILEFGEDIQKRFSSEDGHDQFFPKYLFKSNLQRAVQIAKRHRDIFFDRKNVNTIKPGSFLISALIANSVKDESHLTIYEILNVFICKFNLEAQDIMRSGEILNPIDNRENMIGHFSRYDLKNLLDWVNNLGTLIHEDEETIFKRSLDSKLNINIFSKEYETPKEVKPMKPWKSDILGFK